jgi:hypothetical protein
VDTSTNRATAHPAVAIDAAANSVAAKAEGTAPSPEKRTPGFPAEPATACHILVVSSSALVISVLV